MRWGWILLASLGLATNACNGKDCEEDTGGDFPGLNVELLGAGGGAPASGAYEIEVTAYDGSATVSVDSDGASISCSTTDPCEAEIPTDDGEMYLWFENAADGAWLRMVGPLQAGPTQADIVVRRDGDQVASVTLEPDYDGSSYRDEDGTCVTTFSATETLAIPD